MQTANITVKNKSECNNSPKRKHLKESLLQRKKIAFMRAMDDEKQEDEDFMADTSFEILDNFNDSKPDTNESLRALVKTIKRTMLQISERQERNRDRRHREHMDLLEKYLKHQAGEKDVEKETNLQIEFAPEFEDFQHFTGEEETLTEVTLPEAAEDKLQSDFEEELKLAMTEDHFAEEESHSLQLIETTTEIKGLISQGNEFKLMRDQMFEMQRKKMEDRERKNVKFK